jgi:hypothetical protein
MLGHLKNEPILNSFHLQCIENGRYLSLELNIYDSPDNLYKELVTWEICPFLEATVLAVSEKEALRVLFRQDLKAFAMIIQ